MKKVKIRAIAVVDYDVIITVSDERAHELENSDEEVIASLDIDQITEIRDHEVLDVLVKDVAIS